MSDEKADWKGIELDPQSRRAFQPGGVTLDLSSIAKGYAVDLCALRLAALNIPSFLLEIGGEFVGRGVRPDAQPWRVALDLSDLPPAPGEPPRTFAALVNQAIATSGDFVRRNGQVHHLLDGRTQRPTDNSLSGVAVFAATAMDADGWATALFALGPEEGLRLATARNLAAVLACRTPEGACTALSPAAAAMLD
jgi:thiamine biosynthesis lipoprotein